MDKNAQKYFEVLVLMEYTLRAIRRLMKAEGHNLSELEDSILICKMLEILGKEKEDLGE